MLLEGNNISFSYGKDEILKDVSIKVESNERVGLIASSGFGKSTLAKILAGYEKPSNGGVFIDGNNLKKDGFCPIQLIYQHPEISINPRWKMKKVLEESEMLNYKYIEKIGINKSWLNRFSSELSGGELQRFSILRALNQKTKFLICDEITTMLDVITQAQIWNFLLNETEKRNLGMIIVTHNQYLAQRICTRIVYLEEINKRKNVIEKENLFEKIRKFKTKNKLTY